MALELDDDAVVRLDEGPEDRDLRVGRHHDHADPKIVTREEALEHAAVRGQDDDRRGIRAVGKVFLRGRKRYRYVLATEEPMAANTRTARFHRLAGNDNSLAPSLAPSASRQHFNHSPVVTGCCRVCTRCCSVSD